MSCRIRTTCRLCEGKLNLALAFMSTPPANAFVKEPVEQERFGLDVMLCSECSHAQLRQVVDPKVLFENYVYVSGTSPSFVEHFDNYAQEIKKRTMRFPWPDLPFAIEIGSNDGTLLKALQKRGIRVLGVEPAVGVSEQARKERVNTITSFFSPVLALVIFENYGKADVVVANNVFAHIDDLSAVVEGVKTLLRPGGLFVFEVQYVGDLLKSGLFDMVYHEHLSYHALQPVMSFLETRGMRVIDVQHVPTHGGSIRVWAVDHADDRYQSDSVGQLLTEEEQAGTNRVEAWHQLAAKVERQREELHALLKTLKGRRIVGYGAPAKATTFCYQMGIGRETIEYIVDDSPLKQELLTPGLHIPVEQPAALYEDWPDYVLILAWNFADSIISKHQALREGGTHFIAPFPTLKVTE